MKKKIISLLIAFSFLFIINTRNVLAQEVDYTQYIKVINNDTNSEVDIDVKEIKVNSENVTKKMAINSRDQTNVLTKEIEITFDIPELKENTIQPFSSIDTTRNHGDFRAYLKINYETAGTNEVPKIKVTSVNGSWQCTSSSFTARFEDKEVLLKQGNWLTDGSKYTLVKYPSGNTFYYSTGWDYTYDLPKTAHSGTYATTTAKAIINGMGGGYTIVAELSK